MTPQDDRLRETFKRFTFLFTFSFSKFCNVPYSSLHMYKKGHRKLSDANTEKIIHKLKELQKHLANV